MIFNLFSLQFAKDTGKYIEEKKLKVVLISPPSSPVLLPLNGDIKQDPSTQTNVLKDRVPSGIENIPPPLRVSSSPSKFQKLISLTSYLNYENTVAIFCGDTL